MNEIEEVKNTVRSLFLNTLGRNTERLDCLMADDFIVNYNNYYRFQKDEFISGINDKEFVLISGTYSDVQVEKMDDGCILLSCNGKFNLSFYGSDKNGLRHLEFKCRNENGKWLCFYTIIKPYVKNKQEK